MTVIRETQPNEDKRDPAMKRDFNCDEDCCVPPDWQKPFRPAATTFTDTPSEYESRQAERGQMGLQD
jgi:hypothetical protein